MVSGLQEAISRRLDALHPVVVSFGKIEGGKAFNVIADRVTLLGTVRCLSADLHERLPAWIEETVQAICGSFGATALVRYRCIAPPVRNDPALTALLERSAVDQLGAENVQRLDQPSLGAEDFAELLKVQFSASDQAEAIAKIGLPSTHRLHLGPQKFDSRF